MKIVDTCYRCYHALIAVLLALIFSTGIVAPTLAENNQSSTATYNLTPGPYVLSPNDQLNISVAGHDDLKSTVTILTDGTFNFPDVGTVHAAGMTLSQLSSFMTRKLSTTINQPDVTVSVVTSLTEKASIIGAVRSPGQYPVLPGSRILDLIAASGGLETDPVYSQAMLVQSATGKTVYVDLNHLMNTLDMTQDLPVAPNDVLVVQAGQMQQVQVMGEVAKPGSYPAGKDGQSAAELLTDAGGPAPDAALSHAQILHNGSVRVVDLRPAASDLSSQAAGYMLMPGDVLEIPQVTSKVAVLGDVRNPGAYQIPDGGTMTLVNVLTLAGGTSESADVKNTTILHRGPTDNGMLTTVDIGKLLKGKAKDITLEPNDIVFVPDHSKNGLRAGDVSTLLAPFAFLSHL